jgi:hypothetical protein
MDSQQKKENDEVKNMMKKPPFCLWLVSIIVLLAPGFTNSFVLEEGDKTYIIDRTGERWDVSQARSLGFEPQHFQYGLGKNAFTPLNDAFLTKNTDSIPSHLRVIGVERGDEAQAYSVRRLLRHEIANSRIGLDPIAVGY